MGGKGRGRGRAGEGQGNGGGTAGERRGKGGGRAGAGRGNGRGTAGEKGTVRGGKRNAPQPELGGGGQLPGRTRKARGFALLAVAVGMRVDHLPMPLSSARPVYGTQAVDVARVSHQQRVLIAGARRRQVVADGHPHAAAGVPALELVADDGRAVGGRRLPGEVDGVLAASNWPESEQSAESILLCPRWGGENLKGSFQFLVNY